MIALFDTNIYIEIMVDLISEAQVSAWKSGHLIRLSPIVYHELLRGAREPEIIEEIGSKTVKTAVPTFKMWEKSALILREFVGRFGYNEEVFKLQNDILLALTAKSCGALLISKDRHFLEIAKIISFHFFHYRTNG